MKFARKIIRKTLWRLQTAARGIGYGGTHAYLRLRTRNDTPRVLLRPPQLFPLSFGWRDERWRPNCQRGACNRNRGYGFPSGPWQPYEYCSHAHAAGHSGTDVFARHTLYGTSGEWRTQRFVCMERTAFCDSYHTLAAGELRGHLCGRGLTILLGRRTQHSPLPSHQCSSAYVVMTEPERAVFWQGYQRRNAPQAVRLDRASVIFLSILWDREPILAD